MTPRDQLLSEFIDAWNAGRRPAVGDYLGRAGDDAQRDALAAAIDTFLLLAPTPDYSDDARAEIRRQPFVARALAITSSEEGMLPATVAQLRERLGDSRQQVANAVAQRVGVDDPDERISDLLGALEDGKLDSGRISRRLLDALADVLGTAREALEQAADVRRGLLVPAAGAVMFRAENDDNTELSQGISVLGRAAMAQAPPPMDEIERLFSGGREA